MLALPVLAVPTSCIALNMVLLIAVSPMLCGVCFSIRVSIAGTLSSVRDSIVLFNAAGDMVLTAFTKLVPTSRI